MLAGVASLVFAVRRRGARLRPPSRCVRSSTGRSRSQASPAPRPARSRSTSGPGDVVYGLAPRPFAPPRLEREAGRRAHRPRPARPRVSDPNRGARRRLAGRRHVAGQARAQGLRRPDPQDGRPPKARSEAARRRHSARDRPNLGRRDVLRHAAHGGRLAALVLQERVASALSPRRRPGQGRRADGRRSGPLGCQGVPEGSRSVLGSPSAAGPRAAALPPARRRSPSCVPASCPRSSVA